MFRSVVVVVFQSAFHAEMHQNDRDQHIKTIQNIQKKKLIFSKKIFFDFFWKSELARVSKRALNQ